MSKKYIQPVRGTHDLIGDDMRLFRHIVDTARHTADLYGYDEMQTPIFEFSDVFHRSLGDTSDVVSKETYSFEDRGGESITLRPEFTAAIVRAFISNGYTQKLPFKAFYAGPAFRYERPQKGRQRQFHQVGVECLGADAPWHDVESILCAQQFLKTLLGEETYNNHITLELNTLGDDESRDAYRKALVDYFTKHKSDLSKESQIRLEKNPLRILDSKQAEDREIVKDAPNFEDCLNATSQFWFERVTDLLDGLKCNYKISPRLVRGLDYYSHTVFEFTSDLLGSQATVLAGGRYDKLVEQMGGTAVSGVGWASGVERLKIVKNIVDNDDFSGLWLKKPIAINAADEVSLKTALKLAFYLRNNPDYKLNLKAELIFHKNYSKALKKANDIEASYFTRIENNNFDKNSIFVRNMETSNEVNAKNEDLSLEDLTEKNILQELLFFSETLPSKT